MSIGENNSEHTMFENPFFASPVAWEGKSALSSADKILSSPDLRNKRMIEKSARLTTWPQFVEKFEQLTDVICCAAQFGLDRSKEERFVSLRNWFTEHYYEHASRIRRQLAKCAAKSYVEASSGEEANMDPFEAIFLPRTLSELLAHDHGNLIGLISNVSEAVYSAGD